MDGSHLSTERDSLVFNNKLKKDIFNSEQLLSNEVLFT